MKKMMRRIVPHIIPEFKLLLFRIVPLALILCFAVFIWTEAQFIIRDEIKLLLYGFLLSIAGIYLVRITAFVIKKIITQIPYVVPDVFFDESKNSKT